MKEGKEEGSISLGLSVCLHQAALGPSRCWCTVKIERKVRNFQIKSNQCVVQTSNGENSES